MKFGKQVWHKSVGIFCLLGLAAVMMNRRVHAQETSQFEQVEEGLLDTNTGLVWGHHFYYANHFLSGQGYQATWEYAMDMWLEFDEDMDGVVDDVVTYQEFSNALYDRDDTDWRVPTRDELAQAVADGLMLELDVDPIPGVQLFDPQEITSLAWTSTEGGKKRGGFDSAYVVDLVTGETQRLTVGSVLHGTIAVRGAAPPADDGGGGNGKGKGKKK